MVGEVGMAKGGYLSLTVALMKSEHDELLEWPFNKDIQFKLINQNDRSKDVIKIKKLTHWYHEENHGGEETLQGRDGELAVVEKQ